MSDSFPKSFFADWTDTPARSISAPPKLEYNNLFSYPVISTQLESSPFSNSGPINFHNNQTKEDAYETDSTRSRSSSSFINELISDVIQEDDSPLLPPFDFMGSVYNNQVFNPYSDFYFGMGYSSVLEMAKD